MSLTRIQYSTIAILAMLMLFMSSIVALAQPADDLLITPTTVSRATVGMTVDELSEALGDDYDVSPEVRITVDYSGHVISKDGTVQFRAARVGDGDELDLFIVSNPDFATAEGVGPRTSIVEAEAIYGDAVLSWDPSMESREFVSFADGPGDTITFRTPGIGGNNVGIYEGSDRETTEYDEDAVIAAIWISCDDDCPASADTGAGAQATPEPEPTPTPEPEPTPTPEPEATPEPTPTPEADPDDDSGAAGNADDELARTGTTDVVMIALVSTLFVIGGAFVLIERRYLCPAWLRR